MWDDVSEWMKHSKDLIKNTYRNIKPHDACKLILLVLTHNIKLCTDEDLEEGDNGS